MAIDLTDAKNIVIIGGGQAAAQACASLRQYGHEGKITLIGDEAALPYQRPPLSKAYMKGEMAEERLFFKPELWYEDNGIDLVLSTRALKIDRAAREVEIEHGGKVAYDALILSTGSRPRPLPLPGADLKNVHDLRTLGDVERIRPQMMAGQNLVIVGAGYIGLEAAAVAKTLGLNVTVLEMADRVLARVTSPVISEFYQRVHSDKGVDIRTGAQLSSLKGDEQVEAAILGDGTELKADIVLVGIGILPNMELAQEAGITCENGIVTDRDARTSDERVFAAGDCACRPLVHYAHRIGRLESVHNAIEQGKLAAAAISGKPRPNEDCPWFWSDQYDLKLQIAGLSTGYDEVVVRGDPAANKFSAFYLKDKRLIAVDAVNSAPEFMVSKKLIMSAACLAPGVLSDTSVNMKEIAASAA